MIPDYNDLYSAHDRALARKEKKRYSCCMCGHTIWQEKALKLPEGYMCDSCIEENQEWLDED